jgi:bifunctional DNA-binding transcriptional regulator/antitoxin component of YhaV-PrlF toxin-antitoxin module
VRNFPLSVVELRKALKIGDGDAVYLFATTLKGEEKVVIRTKKPPQSKRLF